MKTLILTVLALICAQVFAGPLYYVEKTRGGKAGERQTVLDVELVQPTNDQSPSVIVHASNKMSCTVSVNSDGINLDKDRSYAKIYGLHLALVEAMKANKKADGTHTVFICERGQMLQQVMKATLTTYAIEQDEK